MALLDTLKKRAQENPKRIVFPESTDDRVLKAAATILAEGIAHVILLGDIDKIKWRAGELNLDISKAELYTPCDDVRKDEFVNFLLKKRAHKGITKKEAENQVCQVTTFGVLMVAKGLADGVVSGATIATAETLRPALQIIGIKENTKLASSFFIMRTPQEKTYFFADCGFVINPSADELASIAIATADSAKSFGFEPKVALLSFSTKGSAEDELVQKVQMATNTAKTLRPDLCIDGELQLDAAIVPSVAQKKCPDSPLKGDANVLIFPDLQSGNIGYKLVERFAHAKAIGPIIQGLQKPVNDLSRGCSPDDIVAVTILTVIEAQRGSEE
ncbi:phosphate acetyltransferase [Candidatus Woesearchaeota archaeon]|nr:phosphate acetyltransferase [Candidatus Woesearchaeota archaeon]